MIGSCFLKLEFITLWSKYVAAANLVAALLLLLANFFITRKWLVFGLSPLTLTMELYLEDLTLKRSLFWC